MRDKRDMRVRDARDTRNERPRVTFVTHAPQVNLIGGSTIAQLGAKIRVTAYAPRLPITVFEGGEVVRRKEAAR